MTQMIHASHQWGCSSESISCTLSFESPFISPQTHSCWLDSLVTYDSDQWRLRCKISMVIDLCAEISWTFYKLQFGGAEPIEKMVSSRTNAEVHLWRQGDLSCFAKMRFDYALRLNPPSSVHCPSSQRDMSDVGTLTFLHVVSPRLAFETWLSWNTCLHTINARGIKYRC